MGAQGVTRIVVRQRASGLSELNRSLVTVAETLRFPPTEKSPEGQTWRLLGHERDNAGMLAGQRE
jgi:hypothetical protein